MHIRELITLSIEKVSCVDYPRSRLFYVEFQCGKQKFSIYRRYSDFRALRDKLCILLSESKYKLIVVNHKNSDCCSDRCHYLSGIELDKFPKKKIIHTKTTLETRANELFLFLKKICLRLNLCKSNSLIQCAENECRIIQLLAAFLSLNFYKIYNDNQIIEQDHNDNDMDKYTKNTGPIRSYSHENICSNKTDYLMDDTDKKIKKMASDRMIHSNQTNVDKYIPDRYSYMFQKSCSSSSISSLSDEHHPSLVDKHITNNINNKHINDPHI